MSDSEDTDDLLLIPPDFFAVQSEPEPPYYGIVDSLIKQVFILQDRIDGIEHMSDVSLSTEVDGEMATRKPPNRRYYSYDDLHQPSSSETTPLKVQRQFQLTSLPNSPNVATRNVKFNTPQKSLQFSKTRPKDDGGVLEDVDRFLSNVRTIQRGHAVRNLEDTFNKQDVTFLGGKRVEKVNAWQCGDRESGGKNVFHKEPPVNSMYQLSGTGNVTTTVDKSSDSSSELTQLTALPQNVFAHDTDKHQKKRGINTLTDNLGLLNLADIWGAGAPSQTVHEERLRRQHCELLIQELQGKNLEMQQKLAVAIRVDQTKNEAIEQFQEVLESASGSIEKLLEEKRTWELEIAKVRNQLSVESEAANKKIAYYENQASKSSNMVQATNTKITELETRCTDLQTQLRQLELKFNEVQTNYQREYQKNQQLADIISQKEIELKENKTVLSNAREEVAHSRKAVEVCQAELTALKNECSLLQSEARESQKVISSLNEQKKQIASELQVYKANEKSLRDALEQSKHKLETTKVELRNFYQGQLELIVENKRKEMQHQLDRERESGLEEMKRKELSMAKTAANHIKEISEKCALETKLLDQKHQEEIRLYRMQLEQRNKEVEQLKGKLALLPEKRAEIAKHLQKVMESQWNEALKMIGDRSSPPQDVVKQCEYDDTPVSSRGSKSETAIQKYIDMLLNRPPGNPDNDPGDNKRSTWHVPDLENRHTNKGTDRKTGKPPWK